MRATLRRNARSHTDKPKVSIWHNSGARLQQIPNGAQIGGVRGSNLEY